MFSPAVSRARALDEAAPVATESWPWSHSELSGGRPHGHMRPGAPTQAKNTLLVCHVPMKLDVYT